MKRCAVVCILTKKKRLQMKDPTGVVLHFVLTIHCNEGHTTVDMSISEVRSYGYPYIE